MIKRFAYIALLLILVFAQRISFAGVNENSRLTTFSYHTTFYRVAVIDTTKKIKQQQEEEKKKEDEKKKAAIKEIAKAKRQVKPEKVDEKATKANQTRDRRPEGMQRPPEIPRRNGN